MVRCEALWLWGRILLREMLWDWEVTETQNIHHISSSHRKRLHGYHQISLTQCDHTLKLFDLLDNFCVGSECFFKGHKSSQKLLFGHKTTTFYPKGCISILLYLYNDNKEYSIIFCFVLFYLTSFPWPSGIPSNLKIYT